MTTTTPIVYADTDGSAPAKDTNTAGRMISILDGCLVNGYGAKSAAGWTKPYTGTNIAVYRMATASPATGFYLYVDDSNTAYTTFRGCEAASDAILANLTNPFPTTSQIAGGAGLYIPRGASGGDWTVVADAQAFYIWVNSNAAGNQISFFGDFVNYSADAYGCIAIGNTSSAATPSNCNMGLAGATWNIGTNGHYLARDTAGNLSVNNTKLVLGQNGLNSGVWATYPNPGNSKLLMCPFELTNGATVNGARGKLPGCQMVLHNTSSIVNRDTFSQGSDTYIALGCYQSNSFAAVQTNQWVR